MKANRLTSVFGIAWAAAAIPLVLFGFMGMDAGAGKLVRATGISVSPWFTGGDSLRSEDHGAWRAVIHRPVTRGLLGERRDGFVQVDWKPAPGAALPQEIEQSVDLDGEGTPDVRVLLDTVRNRAEVRPLAGASVACRASTAEGKPLPNGSWSGIGEVIDMEGWRLVRIAIRK